MAVQQRDADLNATGRNEGSGRSRQNRARRHHFVPRFHLRRFAVLFDDPIGSACGLKVLDFDPYESTANAYTIECDLSTIEERAVTEAVLEVL